MSEGERRATDHGSALKQQDRGEPPAMGYRELLGRPGIRPWLLVTLAAKLPVAMAPLALVFLVRETSGGYTLGAVLGGAYVVGEVVGAPLLGARLRGARLRRELSLGLLGGAGAFAGLAFCHSAPPALAVVLAFLAGAAPSAHAGGLRALLVAAVPEHGVARALSVETTLSQGIWAVAPAAVAFLALGAAPGAPLGLAACCAALAAVGVRMLPAADTDGEQAGQGAAEPPSRGRALAAGWPVYLTSAAAMALLATAELVLPALLESRGLPVSWSGPLLTVFSVASVVGGLLYGARRWPGGPRAQSLVLLVAMAAFVALIAVLPGLVGIAVGLVLAGAFKSGVMVTRNLSLRERVPAGMLAAGYSLMYAVQGVGYSLTASLTAVILANAEPGTAVLCGAALTLLLTLVSASAEYRSHGAQLEAPPDRL
ncbi:MFS transporter [Kitasatospora aureofaciens]|uniref:MFS transporter n=1 Tax=Kitasatospora aureofaciens TaxID=1894 RepID=UPI0037C4F72F